MRNEQVNTEKLNNFFSTIMRRTKEEIDKKRAEADKNQEK